MAVPRACMTLLALLSGVSMALSTPTQHLSGGRSVTFAEREALYGQADPAQPLDPGVAVYLANYCGICHELPTAGTRGTFGPSHVGMGTIAAERVADVNYGGEATTSRDYILESIIAPNAYLAPGYATSTHPMPSFAHLSEADIAALVTLLLSQ